MMYATMSVCIYWWIPTVLYSRVDQGGWIILIRLNYSIRLKHIDKEQIIKFIHPKYFIHHVIASDIESQILKMN